MNWFTLALLLVPLGAVAIKWGSRETKEWSVLVAMAGLLAVIFGLAMPLMGWVDSIRDGQQEALESRYGISIDRASLSMTGEPEPWRINGEWYTCYVEKSKTPGERLDLFCGTPVEDYRSADFISADQ